MKNCVKSSNSAYMAKVMLLCFSLIVALPLISSSALIMMSGDAHAANTTVGADDNVLSETMCRVLNIVTGTGGKTFAAFAIVSVGIGFFTGKVSWGLMVGVAAGIAAIFGAPSIVAALSGETVGDCDTII